MSKENKKCNCWDKLNEKLKEHSQMQLSEACRILQIDDGDMKLRMVLPLTRLDGKKPRGDDPETITMSNCPFCGIEF